MVSAHVKWNGGRMFCFKSILGICIVSWSVASSADSVSLPKYYIGINPAEDRWVTMTSGQVYQGIEISYLLGQELLNTGQFMPILLQAPVSAGLVGANDVSSVLKTEQRDAQIPLGWKSWIGQNEEAQNLAPQSSQNQVYSITVTPIVETLIYASGARSDRFVFGFSPDHINPFNQGRAGAQDNEYVAAPSQAAQCAKPDFFTGQFNPTGWGPFSSIFGSNFDQGATFDILGEGIGFKSFQYEVIDQIRFIIDDSSLGTHEELVFKTTAKGNDVSVWTGYKGFTLSVDLQRGASLMAALQTILPQIVNSLIQERFSTPWESTIATTGSSITIAAGLNQNVQPGLQLMTPDGNIFQVSSVTGTNATLAELSGATLPAVGEPVQVYLGKAVSWPTSLPSTAATQGPAANGAHVRVSQKQTASGMEKVYAAQANIVLDQKTRALAQKAVVAGCSDSNPGWFETFMDSIFIPYGYGRYADVFDQAAKPPTGKSTTSAQALRIAIIDSGLDVKDSTIAPNLSFNTSNQLEGFDFISWDTRPSDDNGHGTAAAKLLLSLVKKPVTFLSAKVIGPRGETSSSAIYDGFNFAVSSHADAIVVPWSSISSTLDAYTQGVALAAAAQIPVFVAPNTVDAGSNVFVANMGTAGFKTQGLGVEVSLPPAGVGAVEALANWINSK
jgi:hypothetical protein